MRNGDYFENVAKLDQNMAAEIILQWCDKKFWEGAKKGLAKKFSKRNVFDTVG
jgi:hypothetical protein